jgi:hypothetical protein
MIRQQQLQVLQPAVAHLASDPDARLLGKIVGGDERAIGAFVDRWASSLYTFTDGLRMDENAGDAVVDEVFRRVLFEAPRFVARPDRFQVWLRSTLRDCASAVVAKNSASRRGTPLQAKADADGLVEGPSGVCDRCGELLRSARIAETLGYLNSLTPFRFTAIYRFDGMSVQNVHLFDRRSGYGSDGSVTPSSNTFCLWIQETLSVVQMSDSLTDPRAIDHPKREVVRSYCGGPISDDAGNLLGTICHFDYEPREIPSDLLSVLEAVSPMLVSTVISEHNE